MHQSETGAVVRQQGRKAEELSCHGTTFTQETLPCKFLGGLVLWTPGTSELPLAPSHASVPVSPLQLSAESRKPGYQQAPPGDLAALTVES